MRVTVTWDHRALEELAIIWVNSPQPNSVADASERLEETLRSRGDLVGQEYVVDDFFIADGPIALVFSRSEDDRIIRIKSTLKRSKTNTP